MMVPMNATRPMRPTTKKNVVNVIMLPPIFFRSLNQVKAEHYKQEHHSKSNSIPCCMMPARITPPNTNLAMSKQNLPASKAMLWSSFGFSVSVASNCLFSCGFCGLDFSRLVVINLHHFAFDAAKIRFLFHSSKFSEEKDATERACAKVITPRPIGRGRGWVSFRMILEAEPQRTIFFSLARERGIETGPRRGIYLLRRAGISLPVSCSQGLAVRR